MKRAKKKEETREEGYTRGCENSKRKRKLKTKHPVIIGQKKRRLVLL